MNYYHNNSYNNYHNNSIINCKCNGKQYVTLHSNYDICIYIIIEYIYIYIYIY